MATRRSQSVPQGTRAGAVPSRRPRQVPSQPEDVADPTAPRRVVDYALQRRRALARSAMAAAGADEHVDPHPDLLRAAKHHGQDAGSPCPRCRTAGSLVHLWFIYGDELGYLEGRVVPESRLASLAVEFGAFRVYQVEVCRRCGWNHLLLSFVLGDGVPRQPLRAPRDLLA